MRKSLSLLIFAAFSILLSIVSCKKVETITLNDPMIISETLAIEVNTNHQILYSVEPEGTPVTWASSNPGIAYILGDWVAANAVGTAQITGTTPGGGECSFYVNVTPMKIRSFSMPASLNVYWGMTNDLEVTDINPQEATAGSIIWSYSPEGIASHTVEGNILHITGLEAGTTVLSGTGTGGAQESCSINVKRIDASISPNKMNLKPGDSKIFTLKQNPQLYSDITWSIDNPSCLLSTHGNECLVTAGDSEGEAVLTAEFGGYSVKATLTISYPPTKGSAAVSSSAGRSGNSCGWVQLWEDGPKFAEFNIGATISSYGSLKSGTDSAPGNEPLYNTSNVGGLYPWHNKTNGRTSAFPNYKQMPHEDGDIARYYWGSGWREFTYDEALALRDGLSAQNFNGGIMTGKELGLRWQWCDGDKVKYCNGCTIAGLKVSGKIGTIYENNSIFFPAGGWVGYNSDSSSVVMYPGFSSNYWTSVSVSADDAYSFGGSDTGISISWNGVHWGYSIRAVVAE